MKNIFKINDKILISILILILSSLLIYLNNFYNLNTGTLKHWSKQTDDFVFVYNSLLYLEGLPQEWLDHPSLFSFIIFPIFYKIFYFFNYLNFYDLKGFTEQADIDHSLNQLFFVSQISIFIFTCVLLIFFFKIVKKFSGRSEDAFFLSILFIFSTGFLQQANRIESGLISTTFLIIAFFYLIKFLESSGNKSFFYFFLIVIFILSSLMQKKLAYFAMPFLFFSSIFFAKQNKNNFFDTKYFKKNIYLYSIYFFAFLFIFLKTFRIERELDFIFLIVNYSGLNFLLFLYINKFQSKNYQNLFFYNLIFLGTYFIYKYFLIYIFSAHIAVWSVSFTNFIGSINMFTTGEIHGNYNLNSLPMYVDRILSNFIIVFLKYFFSFSYQTILIYINIILFILLFKKISKKDVISTSLLILGFLFFQMVCNFRFEDPSYYIFSEYLLLFSLAILIKNFDLNKKYFLFFIVLIVFLFFSNIPTLKDVSYKNTRISCEWVRSEVTSINENYYSFFASKIPREILLKFCLEK